MTAPLNGLGFLGQISSKSVINPNINIGSKKFLFRSFFNQTQRYKGSK